MFRGSRVLFIHKWLFGIYHISYNGAKKRTFARSNRPDNADKLAFLDGKV